VDRVLYTVINIDSLQYTKGKIGTTYRAALSSLTDSNIFPQVAYASIVNHSASVEAYRRATQHNPTFPKAYYNMALELQAQGLLEEAVAAFSRATVRDQGFALSAYNNLGTVLDRLGRLPEAIQAFSTALNLIQEGDPTESSVLTNLFSSLQAVCDWEATALLQGRLLRVAEDCLRAESEGKASLAMQALHSFTYPFSAKLALRIARVYSRTQTPADSTHPLYVLSSLALLPPPLPSANNPASRALRVGYLVDALANGTISQHLPSLLAVHDRRMVSAHVYLLQQAEAPHTKAFVRAVHNTTHSLRDLSRVLGAGSPRGAAEAAGNVISSDSIHVLLDLAEGGTGARHLLLALRPAPILVSVGYPASQGAEYIQFALSDAFIAPPEYSGHYSEHLLYLPGSALVRDFDMSLMGVLSLPPAPDVSSLRRQFGLPAHGVLFCSFGEAFKVDEAILGVWARILQRTRNSSLWLPRYNALAEENLRSHARQLGLDEARLVFSPPALRCLGGKCTRHNGKGSLVLSDSEYLAAVLTSGVCMFVCLLVFAFLPPSKNPQCVLDRCPCTLPPTSLMALNASGRKGYDIKRRDCHSDPDELCSCIVSDPSYRYLSRHRAFNIIALGFGLFSVGWCSRGMLFS
jgi:protein O-GlcNAc transferase